MNIYYCHGFASQFDPSSSKLGMLSKPGSVHGHNIDYTEPAEEVVQRCLDALIKAVIDIVVGTSYLRSMPAAKWRRPNTAGNWGLVCAVCLGPI